MHAPIERRSILKAYDLIHNAGVVHGDVEPRHRVQDRLIAFERASKRPSSRRSDGQAELRKWEYAFAEERHAVEQILGDSDADMF